MRRLTIVLFVLLALSLFIHSFTSIHLDIGRHLKLGEIIWREWSVPTTNLFSYTEPEHTFINHHWASEVVFYLVQRVSGLTGLIVLKAAILMLAAILAMIAARRRPLLIRVAAGLAGLFFLSFRTEVRPEMFSYLFFSIFLFVLFRRRWYWILPLVEIAWVNTHISFFFGPLLVLLWMIGRRRVALPAVLTLAAVLVNPHGINGALYPLSLLRSYGFAVTENQPLFSLGFNVLTVGFVIAACIAALLIFWRRRKIFRDHFFETALLAATAVGSLLVARTVAFFGLALIPALTVLAPDVTVSPRVRRVARWLFITLLSLGIVLVVSNQRFGFAVPTAGERAITYLSQHPPSGRIFNNFNIGSFLIWKLYPQHQVFVDGRPEAYSKAFFRDTYAPMLTDAEAWERESKRYDISTIVFDHTTSSADEVAFLARISKDQAWQAVYLNELVIIFTRRI